MKLYEWESHSLSDGFDPKGARPASFKLRFTPSEFEFLQLRARALRAEKKHRDRHGKTKGSTDYKNYNSDGRWLGVY